MNHVVVFCMPADATQRDFESALRERLAALQSGGVASPAKTARAEIVDPDQLPLWSWFIPSPRYQPSVF